MKFILMVCTGKQRRPRSIGKVSQNHYGVFSFSERQSLIINAASEYWVVFAATSEEAREAIEKGDNRIMVRGGNRHGTPFFTRNVPTAKEWNW